jgi:hypothetical protein
VRRKRGIAPAEDPIAVHPKVDEQRCPIVEMQELVLAAAFDAFDDAASDGRGNFSRDSLPLRGMVGAQLLEGSATDGATQAAHGELHFR